MTEEVCLQRQAQHHLPKRLSSIEMQRNNGLRDLQPGESLLGQKEEELEFPPYFEEVEIIYVECI